MTVTAPLPKPQRSSVAQWLNTKPLRRLRRDRAALSGLVIIIAFTLMAVFAPFLAPPSGNCLRDLGVPAGGPVSLQTQLKAMVAAPASCYQIRRVSYSPMPTPPAPGQVMGTSQGYDIFYGIVWGSRTMLRLGLIIVALNLLLGTIIGSISGYYRGWIDTVIQRLIDVIFAFPGLILTVVLVALFKPSAGTIILAFVLTGWASYARILRGDILRTRELEFVDAARALGAPDRQLIFRHILPNSMTSLLTQVVLDLGTVPLGIAALSFLGLGFPVGYADWGQLMSFARAWIQGPPGQPFAFWYVSVFPALSILLFSLGWNLLGDAARDAFDPRQTG
ncbi:ABC transporter permease [Deinococcus ficus]|uniref:ABC transporter permease n=1 Tax=Deinococcus ficus TaxID=317577 RepID=UPI0003B43B12|nr:ABC transporter permease [Deinococcus ficus]